MAVYAAPSDKPFVINKEQLDKDKKIKRLELAVNVLAWELEKASYLNKACCEKMNWDENQWKDYALNYKCPDGGTR